MSKKINILGTEYEIVMQTEAENPKLEDANGLCEFYSKKIVLRTGYEEEKNAFDNIFDFQVKVLRHEIIHAFFHESGLDSYAEDETLVDYLAVQIPKLSSIDFKKILREVTNV